MTYKPPADAYRPLTDEELAGRGLAGWKHECLVEQARRANALAAAARCPHMSYEYPSACRECDLCKALAAYLGETAGQEGGTK